MCPSLGESGGARGTASPISPASARGFVPSRPYTYRSSPYGPHSGTDVGREYSSRHEGRKDGFIRACERFLHQPISRRNGWHKPQDHTCPVVIGEGRRDLLPQRNVTTYRKHPNKHGAGDGVTFSLSRTRQGNCTRFSFAQHTPEKLRRALLPVGMLVGHFDVTPACRGHFAVAPSLTLGTSRSAVDDMVRSPKPTPTFAALAVAAGRQLHLYSSPHMHKHTRPHACTRPRPPPYNPPPPHGVTPPHGVRAPTKGNDHSTPNTEHNIMPKAPINTPKSPNLPTLDKTARTKPNHATS